MPLSEHVFNNKSSRRCAASTFWFTAAAMNSSGAWHGHVLLISANPTVNAMQIKHGPNGEDEGDSLDEEDQEIVRQVGIQIPRLARREIVFANGDKRIATIGAYIEGWGGFKRTHRHPYWPSPRRFGGGRRWVINYWESFNAGT
ncbi:MAG: hypothetical protein L6R35_005288 [Caloplaca aegaea]|nr:MAG: hypothetical protein L6R35_005288 [Caloplaca aegaea]